MSQQAWMYAQLRRKESCHSLMDFRAESWLMAVNLQLFSKATVVSFFYMK